MCIKFDEEPNEVYILQSTGVLGVHFKRFSKTIKNLGTFYNKLALRQFDFTRTNKHLEKLDAFIKEALGKKYAFKLNQLASRKTVGMAGKNSLIDKDRTFFCSELIAKTFKVCNIMEQSENASSNYLPGHFSSDKWDISLEEGIKVV